MIGCDLLLEPKADKKDMFILILNLYEKAFHENMVHLGGRHQW